MSESNAIVSGVAGRYASALFDLAKDAGSLDAVDGDLAELKLLSCESADFSTLIRSPILSREEQMAGMQAILKQAGADELTARFLGVVIENRRLFVLDDIVDAFAALLAEHKGEATAEVASAVSLSQAQEEALRATLTARLERQVKLDVTIDPDLLGGLVVRVGSRMIDSSLRTKLDNLQIAMKEVG